MQGAGIFYVGIGGFEVSSMGFSSWSSPEEQGAD